MGNFNSNPYILPVVGGNSGTWGGLINTALNQVDSDFTSIDTRIDTLETKTTNLSSSTPFVPSFIGLSDTPSSMGSANYFVKINSSGTSLEFTTSSILDLSDTPSSMSSSDAGKVLKVNSAGNAFELQTDNTGSGGGGGIASVQDDTNPVLGGNLNANNKTISNVSSINNLSFPSGSGTIARTSDITSPSVFTSAWTSFNSSVGGSITSFNHLLGSPPDLIKFAFKCTTAEHGYSVGDILYNSDMAFEDSGVPIAYVESNSNNTIKVQHGYNQRFGLSNKTTGIVVRATAGRWQFRIVAVKF